MPAPKYQKLQAEDTEEEEEQPASSSANIEEPPTYQQSVGETGETIDIASNSSLESPVVQYVVPPPYKAVEKLPTYDEMQEWKEHEARQEILKIYFPPLERDANAPHIQGVVIGDDCTFVFAFVLAFFFNWIGLCIGLCIMQVVSSRYGAIAGFGASVIKWLLIIKFSSCCDDYSADQQILAWWIPLLIGTLFIVKGFLGWIETRKLLKLSDEERAQLRFKYMGLF